MLQKALKKYQGTIFLVSHDIDFVRDVATSVLEITPDGIRSYPGGYDYYCEKKAEAAAAAKPQAAGAPVKSVDKAPGSDGAQKLTSKELRQLRAAERAKTAPLMRELKKKVETAEKKIDELQAALDEASAELFNPTPTTDFAEVNRKVRTLQFEIDRYTAEWEEAAEELEKLS